MHILRNIINLKSKEIKDNLYLQFSRLSRVYFKHYTTFPLKHG